MTQDLKDKKFIVVNSRLLSEDELFNVCKEYGILCHNSTNHLYDGKPYSTHLDLVHSYVEKYKHLLSPDIYPFVKAASYPHDVIEDCRQTFNDVNKNCGLTVAKLTYALTNEKGVNRKERASPKYYEGIRKEPGASYLKICDRLANTFYSVASGSPMSKTYEMEVFSFMESLFNPQYLPMFSELADLTRGKI